MSLINMLIKLQDLENHLKESNLTKNDKEQVSSEITLIKAQIPHDVETRFYKLYKKHGEAIVMANGSVCHGCYINLPSSQAIEMSHNDELNVCQNCGRFIYMDSKETISIF